MTPRPSKKVRGHPVMLPPWWLESVNRRAQGMSLDELAAELSKAAHRVPKWDHKTVSNFLRNTHPTQEMMRAFCIIFDGLLEPIIVARSFEEADELHRVARRYDANPETTARKAEFDKAREHLEKELADQTAKLDSGDDVEGVEGVNRRRRPRGVVRGRPQSS